MLRERNTIIRPQGRRLVLTLEPAARSPAQAWPRVLGETRGTDRKLHFLGGPPRSLRNRIIFTGISVTWMEF